MKKSTKVTLVSLIALGTLLAGGSIAAGSYFYQMAVVPTPKAFISKDKLLKPDQQFYKAQQWYQQATKDQWHIKSTDKKQLTLVANYIEAPQKTNKTVVVAHGFMKSKDAMYPYAYLFHRLGYNVLLPDARGHGQSQGNYIGYGWPERLDYLSWVHQILSRNGNQSQIAIFGLSMGAATTMMASGVKQMPSQVKAYIEDCGYTSADAEISYQAKEMYNLPRWPLVPIVSQINRLKNGNSFKEASAVNQLRHNYRPMLFIHGQQDKFVPTKMVYELYKATKGPKELMLVAKAGHANSYKTAPDQYEAKVKQFLKKYFE